MSVWNRLKDRDKFPRRWWFPVVRKENPFSEEEWLQQREETSRTIRRVMMSLIGFSLLSLITISSPDVNLFVGGGELRIPFVNSPISLRIFLFVGPVILIGILIYLHIFLGYSLWLRKFASAKQMPFLFEMNNPIAKVLTLFVFYFLVPLVLIFFFWKAVPMGNVNGYFPLILLTCGILIFLHIRRCPDNKRRRGTPIRWISLVLLFFALVLSPLYIGNLFKKPSSPFYRRLMLADYDFKERNLRGVELAKANLNRTNFTGSDLVRANLKEAVLISANLTGAKLMGAELMGAEFKFADLTRADLSGADLSGANLADAVLSDACLKFADLTKAYLVRADLSGAELMVANLREANLIDAKLIGANLTEADLWGVNFRGANLTEADLSRVTNLTIKQLADAKTLYKTKLDENLMKQIKNDYPHLLEETKIEKDE